jgi:Zn-dependent protease with chaperone function
VLLLTHTRRDRLVDALVPAAERLAAQADVAPPPDVLVAQSKLSNALAVPTRRKPLVIVTSSVVEQLTPDELDAVLAHEIMHLANRDAVVMTFMSGPALGIAGAWHDGLRGRLAAVMVSPVWLVGVLLMRASRATANTWRTGAPRSSPAHRNSS